MLRGRQDGTGTKNTTGGGGGSLVLEGAQADEDEEGETFGARLGAGGI